MVILPKRRSCSCKTRRGTRCTRPGRAGVVAGHRVCKLHLACYLAGVRTPEFVLEDPQW